jgi:hypothetical protein
MQRFIMLGAQAESAVQEAQAEREEPVVLGAQEALEEPEVQEVREPRAQAE